MLTYKQVKENGWLVFEAVTGSRAYGLATNSSDTDIRGVFILPEEAYYNMEYTPQVANESNDIVYYELKRFIELLARNNPNMLELLNLPESCILYKNKLMELITPELFLSKLCEQSFANYAFTQIKKAWGLEKKIVNPVSEIRKSPIDFCYVYTESEVVSLQNYLTDRGLRQEHIGLSAVTHIRDCFQLYYSDTLNYSGVIRKEDANDVCLSSIPKGENAMALLFFNKDAYSVYCRQYKEYWDWVAKRNEARYNNTVLHGKKYDSKNMMHVFRLLRMAEEIAKEGKVNVWRGDREWLLDVKAGKYEYDELVEKATQIKEALPELYRQSSLQDKPDLQLINERLIRIRKLYYNR